MQQLSIWIEEPIHPEGELVPLRSGFSSTARISVELSTPEVCIESEHPHDFPSIPPTSIPEFLNHLERIKRDSILFDPESPSESDLRSCDICHSIYDRGYTYDYGDLIKCRKCALSQITDYGDE